MLYLLPAKNTIVMNLNIIMSPSKLKKQAMQKSEASLPVYVKERRERERVREREREREKE